MTTDSPKPTNDTGSNAGVTRDESDRLPPASRLNRFASMLSLETTAVIVKRCLECSSVQYNSRWLMLDRVSKTVWDNLFEVVLNVRTRDACLSFLGVPTTDCAKFNDLRLDGELDEFLRRVDPHLRMEIASQVVMAECDWCTRGNFYSDVGVLLDMIYEVGFLRFCGGFSRDILRRVVEDMTGKKRAPFSVPASWSRAVAAPVKYLFGRGEETEDEHREDVFKTPDKRGVSVLDHGEPPRINHGQHRTCIRAARAMVQPIPIDL